MTEHPTVKVGGAPEGEHRRHPPGLLRFFPLGQPQAMRFYVLRAGVTLLGRSDQCAIPVEDDQVSRRHALVRRAGPDWHIGDCESANGLFVNGERVEEARLRGGEIVRLGGTLFRFLAEGVEKGDGGHPVATGSLVGGPALERVRSVLSSAADSDLSVLLTGETGTGKEVAARYLHERSARRRGPFVAVNCAAIPGQLVESELFGHAKGSFTGATAASPGMIRRAHGGTLLLDEIGELLPENQAKLLRALQDRTVQPVGGGEPVPVDLRLVSATNREPRAAVASGGLRADLFARIAELEVTLPPLRERPEDVPALVLHFVAKHGGAREVTPEALEALCMGRWPFNVRELEGAVRRALVLAPGTGPLGPNAFPAPEGAAAPEAAPATDLPDSGAGSTNPEALELVEALRRHQGDPDQVAQALGISRSQVYRRAQKHGIQLGAFRGGAAEPERP